MCCQVNNADTVSVKSGNLGCYFGPLFHCLASCGKPCQPCQPRRLRVGFTLDFTVPNPENFFPNNALTVRPSPSDHPPQRWAATNLLLLPALLSQGGRNDPNFVSLVLLSVQSYTFFRPFNFEVAWYELLR